MKAQTTITRSYEMVTPEKARKWLDTSIGNRPIKSGKVALFVQYMKAGEWNRDAQPIYFDEDGHLMDGHTRLNAVIKSGATIEVEVKRNFPRADWNKLNTGSVWTSGDYGAANGIKDANNSMAAVKIREALKRGLKPGTISCASTGVINGHVWTNDDYLNLFLDDADWGDDVAFAMSCWRQWHGISASMCAGVIHHLVHDCKWPRDFVINFFQQVYTLERISSNARTLRKRIDLDRAGGAKLTPNYVCLLISKAFEGYALNIPKSKLQVASVHDLPKFPRKR